MVGPHHALARLETACSVQRAACSATISFDASCRPAPPAAYAVRLLALMLISYIPSISLVLLR